MPSVSEGEMLEVTGEWKVHPVYGKQFSVRSFSEIEPEDEEAIMRYLGSGLIKGVGPTLARRIVNEFGKTTFDVMEKEPERLAKIKGITLKKAMEIIDGNRKKRSDDLLVKEKLESVEPIIIIDSGKVIFPTRSIALTQDAGALQGMTNNTIARTEAIETGFKYSVTVGFFPDRR